MKKETIQVEGMSCGHCVSAVEGSVGELQGVSNVKVNLDTGVVDVEYDPEVTSRKDIDEAIDDQGYDVVSA
ncbi:copper chaperone CopZ [Marinococcus luteus]|uniref:copper chaperone CopZ n=1 Tax=Marinococcus luteus TaxID=1122204 RepID=UPI002ACCA321|nr:copper chaperone CopZ [Marinococcus luteus]MDZ5782717.1 copper chaperone CopZ [Marinococcus luteus]